MPYNITPTLFVGKIYHRSSWKRRNCFKVPLQYYKAGQKIKNKKANMELRSWLIDNWYKTGGQNSINGEFHQEYLKLYQKDKYI